MVIGRKRTSAASRMASGGDRPRSRSATRAKSTIRIAFFLTMPISISTAITDIRVSWVWVTSMARNAPMPAAGRVERMVSGWIRLSYSTPSTTYITRITASSSNSTSLSASTRFWFSPVYLRWMPFGSAAAKIAWSTSFRPSAGVMPSARL